MSIEHPPLSQDRMGTPKGYEDVFDLFEEPIDFDWESYAIDDTSPTVLDPEYIENYEQFSFDIMMERFHDANALLQLPQPLAATVIDEIRGEHRRRVNENALSMSRLVEATREFPYFPEWLAGAIRSARQAKATVQQSAQILSLFPEMGGIEVMKATYPLDEQKMINADKHFVAEMMKSFFRDRKAIRLITDAKEMNWREPATNSYANHRFVRIRKAKEAEIMLNGVSMELMSRRSYLIIPENLTQHSDAQTKHDFAHHPIAVAKYLRLSKGQNDVPTNIS